MCYAMIPFFLKGPYSVDGFNKNTEIIFSKLFLTMSKGKKFLFSAIIMSKNEKAIYLHKIQL